MAAPTYQFANNANTILAAPINSLVTTLQVQAGTGALFPTPIANQPFFLTLLDAATQQVNEIVLVTQRVGDVFTIVRGQDGTVAKNWNGGDICANLVTAATVQNMEQIPQAQAAAHNWALDTGGVNAYVGAYSPPITQRSQGMTLRIRIANNNTGPCTLDVGAGASPFLNPDGSQLGSGALIAGGWAEFVDNLTSYQLISSSQQAQSTAGAATTGDMKFRPTSETITGWVIANATTIGGPASNATQRANNDCANLFAWHWNNFSNMQCPVFTSAGAPTTRGANATADFAANKSIAVYDKRGKGEHGVDTMGGTATSLLSGVPVRTGSSTTPGSVLGENLHTLIVAELAVHTHANVLTDPTHAHGNTLSDPGHLHGNVLSDPGHAHQNVGAILGGNAAGGAAGGAFDVIQQHSNISYAAAVTGIVLSNSGAVTNIAINNAGAATGISLSNASAGSGAAHNNVPLVDGVYYYIKL
ncbi:hypothetical protein [Bradyrhizobium uaiense]|uniref:Tail fiber protein n=1 Tax=Bradyrhizobium uaiense TaxID=2594946 RepID=A0A6P1BBA9_9BRAD|nr:hypothetical protein [Bradyrhizobium uaiense]NEU95668.1 hypothetical protein [Bradyrhizobium uaiense]